MGSDHLVANGELFGEMSIVDHVNGLQHSITKSDSFVVDMQPFSHLLEKDSTINSANPRITLQRNLSRKGSIRTVDRKGNERDVSLLATSPRATLHGGGSMPEKQAVVVPGPGHHDHFIAGPVHHQITITNSSISSSNVAAAASAAESKAVGGRRFSFRRSSPIIDPRRILFFFATLSCMGTILLIYFTLSMGGKVKGDENALG